MTKKQRIQKMQRRLLAWFRREGRDLPWRRTGDPYRILVSEIMLQQTQVDRVIPKYRDFVKRFPTLRALARASQAEVVRMWHGLGYNRRAVMLHRLAQSTRALSSTVDELRHLPGIGEYTAEAIRAFAFRAPDAAPVDTNISRVLRRVFGEQKASHLEIAKLAREILPPDTWSWNHALMDHGALICTARRPACDLCPIKDVCISYPCAGDDVRKKPQKKFADSDRMYRGRIVAQLRGSDFSARDLQARIQLPDAVRFRRLLADLRQEGLVAVGRGIISLA